jgi:hypothetical protein
MTLGVPGMGFEDDRDMAKGGKEGMRIAPVKSRPISATLRIQEAEWRCLSFLDARIVVGGGDKEEPLSSSGGDRAEQTCTASLKKDMMPLSVPLKWHTKLQSWVVDDGGLTPEAIEKYSAGI